MRDPRTTFVIDATQPVGLLEVDNILDNAQYKWCEDDIDADTATYDEFNYGPDFIVPAGTKVKMDYLWGYSSQGMTGVVDYEITVPKAAKLSWVVYVILSVYHGRMQQDPEGSGRFYFIEQTVMDEDGSINVHFGT